MSNRSVTSLYTDKQGTVWVGTYWGGVNFSLRNISILSIIMLRDTGLSFPVVGAMAEDKSGNIWICTEGGDWIYINRDKGSSSILMRIPDIISVRII